MAFSPWFDSDRKRTGAGGGGQTQTREPKKQGSEHIEAQKIPQKLNDTPEQQWLQVANYAISDIDLKAMSFLLRGIMYNPRGFDSQVELYSKGRSGRSVRPYTFLSGDYNSQCLIVQMPYYIYIHMYSFFLTEHIF